MDMAINHPILTPNQIPDKAMQDNFNRQIYLGNGFILPIQGIVLAGTSEVPVALISNPTNSKKAMFLNNRKVSASGTTVFRFYGNPTISSPGANTIPLNLRPSSTTVSVAACMLRPIVTGTNQIQTIATVADIPIDGSTGSLNDSYFLLTGVSPPGVQDNFYVWYNVNNTGGDPALGAGFTGIQVAIPQVASANAVATATRAAIAAITSVFTVTGATNQVIVTNVNPGFANLAVDSADSPTFFTFTNTFPGNSNFGSFVAALPAQTLLTTESSILFIADPGISLLITAQASASGSTIFSENSWYEIS